jgi:hypothetical protein
MIDSEVIRLRRLRDAALRVRAIAAVLDPRPARRHSVVARSGQSCWRIARIITGTLRAHPYLNYQRGPSEVRAVYDRIRAGLLGGIVRHRGRSLQTLCAELQRVAHELDDTRALTWSAELSDTLGRSQTQMRRLIKELDAAARTEAGSGVETDKTRVAARGVTLQDDAGRVAGTWPYLAF